mgnify:CR=1 FL=1|jgi:hypothetical protein
MALQWTILQLERHTSTGGVFSADWIAEDHEVIEGTIHRGMYQALTSFTPEPDSEGFTPFADLTEADIVTWLKTTLSSDEMTSVEQTIATQISESKAPTTAKGLPW